MSLIDSLVNFFSGKSKSKAEQKQDAAIKKAPRASWEHWAPAKDPTGANVEKAEGDMFNFLLVGEYGTGKSTFLRGWQTGDSEDSRQFWYTRSKSSNFTLPNHDKSVTVKVHDIMAPVGRMSFSNVTDADFTVSQGALIFVNASNSSSWEKATTKFIPQALNHLPLGAPIALVVTHGDELQSVVTGPSMSEIRKYADKHDMYLAEITNGDSKAVSKTVAYMTTKSLRNLDPELRKETLSANAFLALWDRQEPNILNHGIVEPEIAQMIARFVAPPSDATPVVPAPTSESKPQKQSAPMKKKKHMAPKMEEAMPESAQPPTVSLI